MRDYSVVTPAFWIGATGKELRGDTKAQVLAMYLMTSPHSTMTGVFHCPVLYMAHETGLSFEGASEALGRLIESGFCEYEAATETVFVVRMARFQIADHLKAGDNRIAGLKKDVAKMASSSMRSRFLEVHGEAFGLVNEEGKTSPSKAPPKPRTGTGTGLPPNPHGGFDEFWKCWPKNDRKQDKSKCEAKWVREGLDQVAATIMADVESKKLSKKWLEGYVEGPLVYLNNRRWEDGNTADGVPELKYGSDEYFEFHRKQSWWADAGFGSVWEAASSRCNHKNFHQFRDGQKIKEAA